MGALLSFCKAPAFGHCWKEQIVMNTACFKTRPYET